MATTTEPRALDSGGTERSIDTTATGPHFIHLLVDVVKGFEEVFLEASERSRAAAMHEKGLIEVSPCLAPQHHIVC